MFGLLFPTDAFHVPPPRPKRKPDHPYPKKPSEAPVVHNGPPSSCVQDIRTSATNTIAADGSTGMNTWADTPTNVHLGEPTDQRCAFSTSSINGVGSSALWRNVGQLNDGRSDTTSLSAAHANALAAAVQQVCHRSS